MKWAPVERNRSISATSFGETIWQGDMLHEELLKADGVKIVFMLLCWTGVLNLAVIIPIVVSCVRELFLQDYDCTFSRWIRNWGRAYFVKERTDR